MDRSLGVPTVPSDGLERPMMAASTAVVLVGFQNDYFADDGLLRPGGPASGAADAVLANTVALLECLESAGVLLVSAPIAFVRGHEDLLGILEGIKSTGALQQGSVGAALPEALERFEPIMSDASGRHGLNAFTDTALADVLTERGITDVVLVGALTCLCIDWTGRSAMERGFRVTVLSDCTLSQSRAEGALFYSRIFPLYAEVRTSKQLLDRLSLSAMATR